MSYEDDIQIDDDGGYQRNRKVHPNAIQNKNDFDGDALGIATKSSAAAASGENKDDGLFSAESDNAVQFGAVKPYVGAIVAPTRAPPNNPEAPDYSLSIDWVYGYRGYDSRSNLVWNGAREMVYPVAGVVVIHNAEKNAQRFFSGHNDDVTCLAQHPLNPNIIATGQVATIVNKKATLPHICIVDTVKKDIKVLKNVHKRAVRTLGFSADGRYLASVGDDNEQTVIVWDTETKQQVASEKGDTNKILYLRWNHKDPSEFVTVGKNHCYIWQFSANPAKLTKKRGRLGDRPQLTFHSVAFSERGYACVGGEDGQIYVFVKGECQKTFKVHEGPIFALDDYPGGLVSGGRDGKVVTLGADVKPIRIASVPFGGGVRSVYVSGNDVLVGTDRGCICEFPNFTRQDVVSEPVVRSHWDGELWALAVHPDGRTFATAGEDNVVALWDLQSHKMVASAVISEQKGKVLQGGPKASTTSRHPPNQCARAAAFSADGKVLAIGTNQGFFVAYSVTRTADGASLKPIASVDLNSFGQRNVVGQTENWIQTVQFSPDGKAIAVGTHGMVIVLLDTQTYTVKATMKAHHAAITHMDWSKDSTHLQSNCRAYELLFHDVNTKDFKCSQNPVAKALRDVDWKTQTCIFGWSVSGIFDPDMDGTDINSCDASPSRQLLVTGDDFGKVNLYRFPCLQSTNKRQVCAGHSSHVALVRFTPDEKFVISVGGEDKSIIQWRVNPMKKN